MKQIFLVFYGLKKVLIIFFCIVGIFYFSFKFLTPTEEKCKKCHNLSSPSPSHSGLLCTDCHGGDPKTLNKELAHKFMLGKNPSSPKFWDQTCGRCHFYQLERVKSSLMYSNIGIINKIFSSWEFRNRKKFLYGTFDGVRFLSNGEIRHIKSIKDVSHISADLYRKFCSRCHIGYAEYKKYRGVHGSGCAACHFPYNEYGVYRGKDKAIFNKWSYSEYHKIILPSSKQCLHCHNRSARIGLSYIGLCELNNSMVPTLNGLPGPEMISSGRSIVFVKEDVHFKAGMECIDCHTSREVMGDGYVYSSKEEQVEIKCFDCHGTGYTYPKKEKILRENHPAVLESKYYSIQLKVGTEVVLTSKNRPFSNVFFKNNKVVLIGKLSGKLHEVPIITNTKEHTIYGHKRLSCSCCHSLYVQQCYGCHVKYDLSLKSKDYLKDRFTYGKFNEKEDYRRLYPFPLAVNSKGKIVPVTPGCQTFLTVIDKRGKVLKKDYIAKYKGKHSLRFAPIVPHTIQKKGVNCRDCHTNTVFLGLGQTVFSKEGFIPILVCEKNMKDPLDGFLILRKGKLKSISSIIGKKARGFNKKEIKKILSVARCLVCHDDPKDPIYQKKLDYSRLNVCLSLPWIDPYRKGK